MLREISTLRKILRASGNRAQKGLLFRMDTKMIEEVAPLTELFAAAFVLALHYSSDSFGVCMFIFQDFIMGGIWDMFTFTNSVESLGFFEPIFLRNNVYIITHNLTLAC